MILDLKKVFLSENEKLSVETGFEIPGDAGKSGGEFSSEIRAKINVENHAGLVEFRADVSFDYHFNCDRCYEPVDRGFAYGFSHILVVSRPEGEDDDYIEAPDYMLDTDALLRDDILLELPSKLLCKDSCKGLCPKCGKNLNEGDCGCPVREPDPRFAALSALLKE